MPGIVSKRILEPWVMRLCSVAIAKAPAISGLSRDDVADVVQDIWYNLLRFAVGNPTKALELLAQDDISRVMGLVKTTVKNRVIEIGRKYHGYTLSLPDDNSADGDKDGAGTSEFQTVEPSASEPILDITS